MLSSCTIIVHWVHMLWSLSFGVMTVARQCCCSICLRRDVFTLFIYGVYSYAWTPFRMSAMVSQLLCVTVPFFREVTVPFVRNCAAHQSIALALSTHAHHRTYKIGLLYLPTALWGCHRVTCLRSAFLSCRFSECIQCRSRVTSLLAMFVRVILPFRSPPRQA